MAYQIDFTASNYAIRSRRKLFLRLLLLASVAGAAYAVYDGYTTYTQPTLNMKLAEYEAVAFPIEEINKSWDGATKEYNAMLGYYRLIWAGNPTNFLNAMSSTNAPHLSRGFLPVSWILRTGGECQLDYRYVFDGRDKAEQAKGLEAEVVNAVTSIVKVVDGKVDVKGVQLEYLLDVKELSISARFSFPNVKPFLVKNQVFSDCVNRIVALRTKVQNAKIPDEASNQKSTTAFKLMSEYIEVGKEVEGIPNCTNAINICGWFKDADKFVNTTAEVGKVIPETDVRRRQHSKDVWNKVGEARWPWKRFDVLDNNELVRGKKDLVEVSNKVKNMKLKSFLDQHHDFCRKKLERLIEVYDQRSVFSRPDMYFDLTNRVAKAAGITCARVSPLKREDEITDAPAILVKENETFTFTWVRWTLLMGDGSERDGERVDVGPAEQLTLEKVADCTRRVLTLGPGYVLNMVRVNFNEKGQVSGAVLKGLLPVKMVETKIERKNESEKESMSNVN